MTNSQNSNSFIDLMKRTIAILRTDGPVEVIKRIKGRLYLKPLQSHCFVYRNKYCAELPPPICEVEVEFKELTAVDIHEIEELTAVDEWHTPKLPTLRRLREGEHIYIAKHEGRIVASYSIITKERFQELYFRGEVKMALNEVYAWRGFCAPAFRGRAIFPALGRCVLTDMALKYGKYNALTTILTNNKSSQRTASKFGWVKVGRAGFIEIFGIRLQYLWGREAFKETRRRFFIQDMGKVHPVFRGVML